MMRVLWAALMSAVALFVAPMTAHAANYYVDNALGDVPAETRAVVAEPKPVQLLFQFTARGAANARATTLLAEPVANHVRGSGVFSEVTTTPAANGAIVSIIIDNIPQENAASSGFATGLTFGLRGTVVADYYVATIEYVSGADGAKITKTVRHTLYTTIGRTDPPATGTRARNMDEAVHTVMRQITQHLVNDLARDPAFSGAPPAAAAEVAQAEPAPAAPQEPAATVQTAAPAQ